MKPVHTILQSQKVLITALLVASIMVIAAIFYRVSPMIEYAEGWTTFYYNTHFIGNEIAKGNAGMLISSFFLQFFHNPLHGIILMTLLYVLLEALLMAVISRFWKSIFSYVVSFAIVIILTVLSASSMGKMPFASVIGISSPIASENMKYAKLSNMSVNEDWDGIMRLHEEGMPENNLLNQNIINMAMAEKGLLHEHLTDNNCVDINSIYVSNIQSEYIAAMISDVYYSMGHIAEAQHYAFEANEKFDNNSPRLLQRLIKTNIIYGEYKVAEKYLRKLSDAIYYKEWCNHYSKLLNDKAVAADQELSMKRKCLNITNKFSGFGGLDKDLLEIARASKGTLQSRTTVQFLSALYRLANYQEEYYSLVKEFNLSAQ